MPSGLREAVTICGPPFSRLQMLAIDIEDVNTGDGARRDADQRRVLLPEFTQTIRIALRFFETVWSRRTLIFQAWEAEPPIRTQHQRCIESCVNVGAGHAPAPVSSGVFEA
jgi:hypothetical protein